MILKASHSLKPAVRTDSGAEVADVISDGAADEGRGRSVSDLATASVPGSPPTAASLSATGRREMAPGARAVVGIGRTDSSSSSIGRAGPVGGWSCIAWMTASSAAARLSPQSLQLRSPGSIAADGPIGADSLDEHGDTTRGVLDEAAAVPKCTCFGVDTIGESRGEGCGSPSVERLPLTRVASPSGRKPLVTGS